MRIVLRQFALVLSLTGLSVHAAEAEEFKYYVWIDEEGIVHAEEQAPKGVDYEVRIIEDINANVIPAEDFRLYEDAPATDDSGSGGGSPEPASPADDAGGPATPDSPEAQR